MKQNSFPRLLHVVAAGVTWFIATEAWPAPGDLYVTESGSNSVLKFTPTGSRNTFVSGLNGPSDLAFDSSGNLFVIDAGNHAIVKISPAGSKTTFTSSLDHPV